LIEIIRHLDKASFYFFQSMALLTGCFLMRGECLI